MKKEDPHFINERIKAPVVRVVGENVESGIYNIASENNVTLLQLSELIKDIIGGDVSIVLNNQFGSSSESHRQCKIDITKSIEKIGFKPKISLRDGISKLLKGD